MTFTAYSCHRTDKMARISNMPLNVRQLHTKNMRRSKGSTNVDDEMKTVNTDALLANEWI